MTYFLPPSATPAPASVIVSPNAQNTQTPHATLIQSTPSNTQNASTNSITTGRRNSPSNNSGNNSSAIHSIATQNTQAAAPIQTFPQSVPFSLATVPETTSAASGAAIYAIPPTCYPNMYPAPTATGYYQPLPHPQTNTTIISSVVPHSTTHHLSGTVPSTPHAFQTNSSGEILTHFPFSQQHSNSGSNATPQSAPSTPLSLTTVPPNFKNPSLFATSPIVPTSSGSAMQTSAHVTNYGDKNNNNGGPKKMIINSSYNSHSKSPGMNGNNHRQNSVGGYQNMNTHGVKKNMNSDGATTSTNSNSHNEDTSSVSNMSSNYNPSNRMKNANRDQMVINSNYQQKSYKNQHQSNNNYTPNSNSGSPNSNETSEVTTHNSGGMQGANSNSKYPTRGPSRIPPLDLKRNNSSANMIHQTRSTPSTNSTESNNSPNSITSYDHSRNYYPSHNPSHHQSSYGQSTIGGHGHYYRGGSAGAVNSTIHHNANHNASDSAPNQTFFPFSVHSQSSGAPTTPLIDSCHPQALIGYNNSMTGMYVKFGQAFTFANVIFFQFYLNKLF
jgi:hypothetical protein